MTGNAWIWLLAIVVLTAAAVGVSAYRETRRHRCRVCDSPAPGRLFAYCRHVLVGPFCSTECLDEASTDPEWGYGHVRSIVRLETDA